MSVEYRYFYIPAPAFISNFDDLKALPQSVRDGGGPVRAPPDRDAGSRSNAMFDILMIALIVALFGGCIAYAYACERL